MTVYRKFKLLMNGLDFNYSIAFEPVGDELWVTYAGFIADINRGWIGDITTVFYDPIEGFDTSLARYEQTYYNVLCKKVEVSWECNAAPTVKYIFEKE